MSADTEAAKTHCPRDHEYSERNTYYQKGTGWRVCRECQKLHQRTYQKKHPEKVAEWMVNHYYANHEEILANKRAYYQANHERVLEQSKRSKKKNAVKVKARRKTYYLAHRDRCLVWNKQYRADHHAELVAYARARHATHRDQINARRRELYRMRKEQS